MEPFAYDRALHPVRDDIVAAQQRVWKRIASPGHWWTGAQRVAIAEQARVARAQRSQAPWLRELPDAGDLLPEAAVRTARMIAADAPKINRDWATQQIDDLGCASALTANTAEQRSLLGDAAYVEIAAVVSCVCAIDSYADALGLDCEPLPAPAPGEPDWLRNEGVTDAGAYVALQHPWQGPNVGRALSLAPQQNMMFMTLVMAMYGGPQDFLKLVWEGGALSRPQVELLAARVSAVNECFY